MKEGMVPGGAAAVFMGGSDGEMRGDPAFSWKIQRLGRLFQRHQGSFMIRVASPGSESELFPPLEEARPV